MKKNCKLADVLLKFCMAGGDWLVRSLVDSFSVILLNPGFDQNLNFVTQEGELGEAGRKGVF